MFHKTRVVVVGAKNPANILEQHSDIYDVCYMCDHIEWRTYLEKLHLAEKLASEADIVIVYPTLGELEIFLLGIAYSKHTALIYGIDVQKGTESLYHRTFRDMGEYSLWVGGYEISGN